MPKTRTYPSQSKKKTKGSLHIRRLQAKKTEKSTSIEREKVINNAISTANDDHLSGKEREEIVHTPTKDHFSQIQNTPHSFHITTCKNNKRSECGFSNGIPVSQTNRPSRQDAPPLKTYSRRPQRNVTPPRAPTPPCEDLMDCDEYLPDLVVESSTSDPSKVVRIEGRRIVDLMYFTTQYDKLAQHYKKCTGGQYTLTSEKRKGLISCFTYKCFMCDGIRNIYTDPPEKKELNTAFAWGATAAGIGQTQAEEMFSVMNIPVMTRRHFSHHEKKVEEVWKQKLIQKMSAAVEEEKSLALENGDVEEGYPFITGIVDGAWCKRSYGHGYSANAGTACVIGGRTGKILYLGVKNKFCYVCSTTAECSQPKQHTCNQNYSGSSSGMEQTIIVEGLQHLFSEHGVWVKFLTGDGDSSVFARARERAPFGDKMKKIECANHIVRGYTSKLHTLASKTTFDFEGRKTIRQKIPRLTAAVRGAIRNSEGNVDKLRKDLRNGLRHVFGDHLSCCASYCSRQDETVNKVPYLEKAKLMDEMLMLLDPIVRKADCLVLNKTTNVAENLNSLICKLTGGKRVDHAKGSSYRRRCYAAALAHTDGPSYMISPWKSMTGNSPGNICKKICAIRERSRSSKRLHFCDEGKHQRKKRKRNIDKTTGDIEYGPNAAKSDLAPNDLQSQMNTILGKLQDEAGSLTLCSTLERATVGQRENPLWMQARRQRLTASRFGIICRMRNVTSCHNIVKNIVCGTELYSSAIIYGRVHEKKAISAYEKEKQTTVAPCGIFVHPEIPYLGASPDGILEKYGIVEVKCVPSIGSMSIREAVKCKNLCIEIKNEKLQLKKLHRYRYQIQGQLQISHRKFCDLIIYCDSGIEVIREERDDEFWGEKMLPKLQRFYMECLLPELADSRIRRGMRVREPQHILQAQTAAKKM